MYRYSRKCPDSLAVEKYKEYKNRLTVLLRITEKDHYAQLIEENKSNLQNAWRILKLMINKKKSTSTCSKFLVNGKYITYKNAIADGFNYFFVNIWPNLASKIPESTTPCTKFTKFMRGDRLSQSIFLSATNEEEITMCIKLLNNGSPGWDNISSKTIKTSCPLIIQPLTHIFNLSLFSGVFPDELKIARIISLFKSGDPQNFSNYRPVCVVDSIKNTRTFNVHSSLRLHSFKQYIL